MIQWPYIGVWMNFWRNPHLKRTWFPIPQVAKCECSPADRFLAFLGRADEVREGFSQRMRWKHRRWKQCRGFTLGCCRPGGCGRGWNINRLNSNPQKYRKVKSYILLKYWWVTLLSSSILLYVKLLRRGCRLWSVKFISTDFHIFFGTGTALAEAWSVRKDSSIKEARGLWCVKPVAPSVYCSGKGWFR